MLFQQKNIQYYYIKLRKRIRKFLANAKSRDFLIFLFFVLIAFGFWLLQTLKDDYQTQISIPVRLKDVPNNVVITSDLPDQLQITVRDKGTVLLNYLLGQNFAPVSIDFRDYETRGNQVRIPSVEISRNVSSQLNSSSTLINIKPDTLEFIYTQGKAKKLPVRLQGEITAARQYYITDTIYSPDSVIVYAPDAIMDTLQYAYTQQIHLDHISDTTKGSFSFMNIKGVKYVPATVDLTFPIDIITEKTLEVSLIPLDFPRDKVLRTFPSKVKVTFHVGAQRFKSIAPEDFVIVVPYEDLLRNVSDKYKLRLSSIPSEVSYARIIPNEIDYLIEQRPEYDN